MGVEVYGERLVLKWITSVNVTVTKKSIVWRLTHRVLGANSLRPASFDSEVAVWNQKQDKQGEVERAQANCFPKVGEIRADGLMIYCEAKIVLSPS
ncbi:hypothetical protein RHGRI_000300 [Rhododendron griersonianum]|uniref:Uncharacterized protein n=1 Tax=Rhododendron griersonianum TaxID=479676 RepID=A0AAV6LIF3_9ERIC|nr:hypothetical protein RHGRI_000300 [Rhododendron griersonianum]